MSEQTTPETDAATHDLSDYGSPVLCSWGDWVDADFARKLERERDEALNAIHTYKCEVEAWEILEKARRERDEARELLASEKITRNHIIKRSVEVEKERDEAREKCRELCDLVAYGLGQSGEPRSIDAMRQAGFGPTGWLWRQHSRRLKRERDEAREKYDLEAVENMLAVNKLCKERDEARGELARIESLLLDPHAVFLNFLRGKIAKLDWANLEHIHGPHPARVERDEAREALKHIGEYGTEEINAAVELRQKLAQALVDLDNMQDQRDLAMKVIKRLECEREEAREALMKIEEVFIDSDDTYEDWRKMGNIARAVLEAAK